MNTLAKSALAAVALTVLSAGAAFAADCCCCKDKDAKMACCDKKPEAAPAPDAPAPDAPAPKPQHQH